MEIDKFVDILEPILITGETGTGKTSLAKTLHQKSKKENFKFIHVNISSIADNLFESELFGHIKGAFTGASCDKIGFCERVGAGTLFLDEIGDLSMDKQARLLTLIEEKSFYSVGSTVEKKFRGRFVFATNKDLKALVKEGLFREDLYFRLRFFEIPLLPLRKKPGLRQIIIDEYEKQSKDEQFLDCRNFKLAALKNLVNYQWPGNYRELKQTIHYYIKLNALPNWIEESTSMLEKNGALSYQKALAEFEERFLRSCMEDQKGRINRTAQLTGLSKPTLISKLKKYGIDRRLYSVNYLQEAG